MVYNSDNLVDNSDESSVTLGNLEIDPLNLLSLIFSFGKPMEVACKPMEGIYSLTYGLAPILKKS